MPEIIQLRELGQPDPAYCDRQDGPGGLPCRELGRYRMRMHGRQRLTFEAIACEPHAREEIQKNPSCVVEVRPLFPGLPKLW